MGLVKSGNGRLEVATARMDLECLLDAVAA